MIINNQKNHKHSEKWQIILEGHDVSHDNALMELDISQLSSSSTLSSQTIFDDDSFMFDSELYSHTDTQFNFNLGQHLSSKESSLMFAYDEFDKRNTKSDDKYAPSQTNLASSLDEFILNGLLDQPSETDQGFYYASHGLIEDVVQ